MKDPSAKNQLAQWDKMYSAAVESSQQIAPTISRKMAAERSTPCMRLRLPLRELLTSGGDERLTVAVGAVLNGYGCAPEPVPGIGEYSSSTASTISTVGWAQADGARTDLLAAEQANQIDEVFDDRVDDLRNRLRNVLRLPIGTDIVFTPSGTDAVLCATFLAETLYGRHLTRIVPLAEETGNGVVSATRGRHFGFKSALGSTVGKNEQVWGELGSSTCICVPGRNELGNPLSEEGRDSAVVSAVSQAVHSGDNVLLLAMDCSKTGLSMPSFKCLQQIASRWPARVQIVVDACQMRLSRARLRQYLGLNFPVIITGSKFFTGPPFCGAVGPIVDCEVLPQHPTHPWRASSLLRTIQLARCVDRNPSIVRSYAELWRMAAMGGNCRRNAAVLRSAAGPAGCSSTSARADSALIHREPPPSATSLHRPCRVLRRQRRGNVHANYLPFPALS